MHPMTGIPMRRQRGSAVTELLLCVFPYALLLLGVILIGQLSIGKQECFKAVGWSGPRPDEQDLEGDVDEYFFFGPGTATFGEVLPYEPEVSQETEEPVLPYAREDIEAAVSRESVHVSHTTRIEDGEVVVDVTVNATNAGKALLEAGLIEDLDGILGRRTLDPDDLKDLSLSFPINEERCQEVSDTLTSWLAYSRSHAGFSYGLGGQPLAFERTHGDADSLTRAESFRDDFEMGGEDDDVFALECASPDPGGFRGFHASESVDMDAFETMGYQTDDGSVVDPPDYRDEYVIQTDQMKELWKLDFSPDNTR